jgi:hypothetical protein
MGSCSYASEDISVCVNFIIFITKYLLGDITLRGSKVPHGSSVISLLGDILLHRLFQQHNKERNTRTISSHLDLLGCFSRGGGGAARLLSDWPRRGPQPPRIAERYLYGHPKTEPQPLES